MDQAPIGKLLVNMECNATAGVNVSHYFITKLIEQKQRGCIVFTSSVAGLCSNTIQWYVLLFLTVVSC